MSQLDRGAYTPQTDAPLAFDARQPRGVRKPLPMALIGSGVVLAALVAGVSMYYLRPAGPPTVGAPVVAVKGAPTAADKNEDPFSNLDGVDVAQNVPPSAAPAKPVYAPPPEAPKPRPAPAPAASLKVQTFDPTTMPPAATPARPAPPPAPVQQVAAAPIKPVPATPAPAPAAVKPATPAPTQLATAATTAAPGPVHLAKPPQAAPAAPTAVPAAAAASVGAAVASVQIGAFSSTELADKGYQEVAVAFPGTVSGKTKRVEPLERDGKTLYRTSVAGFASRGAAQAFCDALTARGKRCLVKG